MGSFMSTAFDENMKKNQQFMLDMNQMTVTIIIIKVSFQQ